jgi:hypothetical protein
MSLKLGAWRVREGCLPKGARSPALLSERKETPQAPFIPLEEDPVCRKLTFLRRRQRTVPLCGRTL